MTAARRPPARAVRRRAPLPADALYGRLLASAAQHLLGAGPAPERGSGWPTAGSSRSRSTAGSRPPTASTRRSSPTSKRRCSTSAAGRAAISPRCARRQARARRRPLARRGPARARPRRGRDQRLAVVAGPARRHVEDDPAAGRQHRHRRRAGPAAAPRRRAARARTARSSSRPTRRARPPTASGCGWRPRASVSEWFRWARVGVDGVEAVARPGGIRGRGGPLARRAARS